MRRAAAILLGSTMLCGMFFPEAAIGASPAAKPASAAVPPPPMERSIRSLRVEGSQRIEPETVLSYTKLRVGDSYTNETVDQAIKDLLASELLADVEIAGVEDGNLVIRIRESPVINRIIFEGNKRLKQDKIDKEVKLRPRQIFTRSAIRADVARIVELYRRQGRFAATVEPKMVSLDQNRVDVIFEITEGSKSKVRQINIIGNEEFSDGKLRGEMATKTSSLLHIFSSNTSYDQDRLAYDQQKLRQFYLTEGYADFRVISAVAEPTPHKKDFIITYVVEEGPRYRWGDVTIENSPSGLDGAKLAPKLPLTAGGWYNDEAVQQAVASLSEATGQFGYAFADVRPAVRRDPENCAISVVFHLTESNRTYVERIDIAGIETGGVQVARAEARIGDGDTLGTSSIHGSSGHINSLGFFRNQFETNNDRPASNRSTLSAGADDRATGDLRLSHGFSTLERFILEASVRQRNFRGKGQTLSASVDHGSYSRATDAGFEAPYWFGENVARAAARYRGYDAFNYRGTKRDATYTQLSSGFGFSAGSVVASGIGQRASSPAPLLARGEVTVRRPTTFRADTPLGFSSFGQIAIRFSSPSTPSYGAIIRALPRQLLRELKSEEASRPTRARDYYLAYLARTSEYPLGRVASKPSVSGAKQPASAATRIAPFAEYFHASTSVPRTEIGIAANWNSPFGPLRVNIAKALFASAGNEDSGDDDVEKYFGPSIN